MKKTMIQEIRLTTQISTHFLHTQINPVANDSHGMKDTPTDVHFIERNGTSSDWSVDKMVDSAT